jgi:hypothetical protein
MTQVLKDAYADIQVPVSIFNYSQDVYHSLVDKYPNHVTPFSRELYHEFHTALNAALAPHAFHLCLFATEVARTHPELVGLPKAPSQ